MGCSLTSPQECSASEVLDAATPADELLGTIVGGAGDVTGGIVDSAAGSAWDKFVSSMVDGAEWAIKETMTLWLRAPDPDLTGSDSVVTFVSGHTAYLVGATMVASFLFSAWRLMIYHRSQDAVNVAETLIRTALVSVCAGTLITAGVELADSWATWILDQAELEFSVGVLAAAQIPGGVLWILALIVILTQVLQLAIMAIRNAMIIVMAGTLTWAAAASGTQMGRQWYQKSIAWIIAFILYKPAAALIYAVAFEMSSGEDMFTKLSGIFLMILAVLTLPALMRLFVPMTAALGGANAGALAGATVGAGIAMGATLATGGAASGAGGFTGGFGAAGSGGGAGFGAGPQVGGGPAGAGTAGLSGGGTGGGGPKGSPPSGSSGQGPGASSTIEEISGGGSDSPAGAGAGGADTTALTSSTSSGSRDRSPSGAPSAGVNAAAGGYSPTSVPTPSGAGSANSGAGDVMGAMQRGSSSAGRAQSLADEVAGDETSGGPAGAGRTDG